MTPKSITMRRTLQNPDEKKKGFYSIGNVRLLYL
jgi:hypothetical protein